MLNSRRSIIVVATLLLLSVACVVSVLADRSADRSFRNLVVSVDTARIQSINIDVFNNDTALILNKKNGAWVVTVPTGDMDANQSQVDELLEYLSGIVAVRQMSNSEQSWARYGVDGEKCTHIVVNGKKRVLADFYCGKVEFDQQTGQIWTYVRNADEPNVYKVNGYLNMVTNRSFSTWVRKY